MFIVFEGVDGSGKDTQLLKTFGYLSSNNKYLQIWKTQEPTGNTSAGKEILFRLKNGGFDSPKQALELYVQDRKEQTYIRKEILKHSIILSSRFYYSTYVYQGLFGISFDEIFSAHDEYKDIVEPDLTFIFDINRKTIESRLNSRNCEREVFG